MASLGNIYLKFGADVSGLSSGIKSVDNQLKGFSSSVKALGGVLGGAFAATSIAGFASDAIKMSAGIETAFLKIKNLTDTTAKDLQYFKKGIAGISSQVGRSQKQLADGLYTITSGGLVGKEAMDALTLASKASAVGMGEVDVVARALTNVLNAYGKENITAARAAEILFNALKLGNLEATELAPALSKVLPVSSALGISMEQVAAFISQASLSGASASEAVTELTSVLDAIIKPSQEAEDVLASVGLTMAEVRDVAKKDLAGALNLLYDKFGQNEEAMGRITGRKEAFVGFYSVVGDRAENYAKILDGVSASTDNLGAAHKEAAQSSAQRWAVFSAQMANVKAAVGDALIALINQLLPQSKEGVDKLNAALGQLPGIAEKIGEKFVVVLSVLQKIFVVAEKLHLYDVLIRPLVEVDKLLSGPKDLKINTDDAVKQIERLREAGGLILSQGGPAASGSPYKVPKKDDGGGGGSPTETEKTETQKLTAAKDKLIGTLETLIKRNQDTAQVEAQIAAIEKELTAITEKREEVMNRIAGSDLSYLDQQAQKTALVNTELKKLTPDIPDRLKAAFEDLNRSPLLEGVSAQAHVFAESINSGTNYVRSLDKQILSIAATTAAVGPAAAANMEILFASIEKGKQVLQNFNNSFSDIINTGISDSFGALGEQIGSALSGGSFSFKAILVPLADMLIQVGKLAISTGLALEGIKTALKTLNPIVAIAGGVALVALGTLVKAKLSSSAPKFAKGGLSYEEHAAIVGDNPNARFDPEVTAPSSKLKKLFEDVSIPKIATDFLDKIKLPSLEDISIHNIASDLLDKIKLPKFEDISISQIASDLFESIKLPEIKVNTEDFQPTTYNRTGVEGIANVELTGTVRIDGRDLLVVMERNIASTKRQRGF